MRLDAEALRAEFRQLGGDERATLQRLEQLAYLLDDRFRIPGLNRRIGLDGLIGLVPGIGDAVTGAIALYLVLEAWRLGIPKHVVARMLVNVGVDSLVGAIPLAGDVFDATFKANKRNVDLLRQHLERTR